MTNHSADFENWKAYAARVEQIAARTSDMIRARAIAIGCQFFGVNDGSIFLFAHNWRGQSWMTPEQNRAAREIAHLESLMWSPGHLAERIVKQSFNRMIAGPYKYKAYDLQ